MGEFEHREGWLSPDAADGLFDELASSLAWEQHEISLFGQRHPVPRLTYWFADHDYTYSGVRNTAHPWTESMAAVRERLVADTDAEYNSCLANLYRDGDQHMGWHRDDEPELGPEPTIASISLGAARDFQVRHVETGQTTTYVLGHGDLLVMRGRSQADYKHQVPKRRRIAEPRINLTFRNFQPRESWPHRT